jgi:hypothetical protein
VILLYESNTLSNTGRVTVEIIPPAGWGPARLLLTELKLLGYEVMKWRKDGQSVLEIR